MLTSSVAYVFCAFITLALMILPTPWHWQTRNSGTLLIVAWTSLGNLIGAINTIVFLNAQEIVNPSWCDFGGSIH